MYEENSSNSIGLQCFYALMRASLNSLATNLPKNLLIALVNKKVWTPNQGLAYALQSSNPSQKAKSLTALANHLPPNLEKLALEKAIAAAKVIQSERYRVDALRALADKLPPELLPDALAAAKLFQDEEYRASALSTLAIPLSKMPIDELFSCWKETLDELSLRTRQDLLKDIENLVPVIYALGSDGAIASVSRAIQKVAQWWH